MAKKKASAAKKKSPSRRRSAKSLTDTRKLGQADTVRLLPQQPPGIGAQSSEETRQAYASLTEVDRHLLEVQQELIRELQASLDALAGTNFESKELNGYVARRIQAMCNSLSVRIKSSNGRASILRWRDYRTTRHGAFELRAQVDGRQKTEYFGTKLPSEMPLVPVEDA